MVCVFMQLGKLRLGMIWMSWALGCGRKWKNEVLLWASSSEKVSMIWVSLCYVILCGGPANRDTTLPSNQPTHFILSIRNKHQNYSMFFSMSSVATTQHG